MDRDVIIWRAVCCFFRLIIRYEKFNGKETSVYMNYSPTPQKRIAGTISAILLVIAAVSYIFSGTGLVSPLPLQTVCMSCICAAVYILVRFVYTGITYIVRPRDNGSGKVWLLPREQVDFCVIKSQGKRAGVTECMLSLDKLVRIDEFTDGYGSRIREEFKGAKLYYYTASMFPEKRQALIFDDGGEIYCIVIEGNEKFLRLLSEIQAGGSTNM